MIKSSIKVVRGNTGGQRESTDNCPAQVHDSLIVRPSSKDLDGPRAEPRGGRRLSDQADANDLQYGPTAVEPGEVTNGRQTGLISGLPVSVVPYDRLQELASAQIRRECRRLAYDWDAFVDESSEWRLTEIVHRRAVQQERTRGLDCRPTDIPTDTVFKAVRSVIWAWEVQPELRPSEQAFRLEQARRGELGRLKRRVASIARDTRVVALVAEGVSNNAEIGRRIGLSRSTVLRIRRRLSAAPAALQNVDDVSHESPAFPAPEIPPAERWPVVQFTKATGMHLDADDARWLVDIGQCYEAEGREAELVHAVQASAGAARDPWAYLQRCVANRGDAWTVSPQLLADVLSWAGQQSLQYALQAISGGYVRRPLPYLREALAKAVATGTRLGGWPERPVAFALRMARDWAPALSIVDADGAIAVEDAAARSGHLDSFRRRFGRLPWETAPDSENADDSGSPDAQNRCTSLKGFGSDDLNSEESKLRDLDSSPGPIKANATSRLEGRCVKPAPAVQGVAPDVFGAARGVVPSSPSFGSKELERGPSTADPRNFAEIRSSTRYGEALKPAETTSRLLPRGNSPPVFEHGPCRHPLAIALASRMVLDDVGLVDCAAGCGHRLYSDRGPVECPCHWPAAKAVAVARALERR